MEIQDIFTKEDKLRKSYTYFSTPTTSSIFIPSKINEQVSSKNDQKVDQTDCKYCSHDYNDHVKEDEYGNSAYSQARIYLKEKKILELFTYLMSHLLVDEPLDPIRHLEQLLKKCLLYKDGLVDPPLLFTSRHIRSMFHSFRPDSKGTISYKGYKAAKTTLGFCTCETPYSECIPGRVDLETFEFEIVMKMLRCTEEYLNERTLSTS